MSQKHDAKRQVRFPMNGWKISFPQHGFSNPYTAGPRLAPLPCREAGESPKGASPELMVVGTTGGGMSFGELFYRRLLATNSRKGFAQLVGNYTPQKPIRDALELNRLRVPTQILTNACSSGSNAIGHGFELVRHAR